MMAAQQTITPGLLDRLPAVRGRLTESARLSGITWFRVGGPAEVMFRPADRNDLLAFLAAKPDDVPVTAIGVASNLLVRDGGVPGVVIRLGRDFAAIEPDGNDLVCGAAAIDVNVARAARNAGIGAGPAVHRSLSQPLRRDQLHRRGNFRRRPCPEHKEYTFHPGSRNTRVPDAYPRLKV